MKIRIMHIAECAGGVDRYLHCLIKYMNHEKYENIVVLSKLYQENDYVGLADAVEIINMTHGMGPKTLMSAKTIRKLIKKYNPDIVYAHSSIAGAITRLANIGLKSKCIYNPHGWSFNMQSNKKNVFICLERFMSRFSDKIVCISEAEKQSAMDNKICCENKMIVIYNGIDILEYDKRNSGGIKLNIPTDVFVVGMVGRICKQKAPDVFIRMAGEIKGNALFLIVGDVLEGDIEERRKVEELAVKLGVNLKITGWVNNPLDYIKLFDVACLLSRWEGFGLAIPEYMLCEKPIVASRVDAIPYLIEDKKNGMLVNVDDYVGAARSVIELRDNEKLRNMLIKNARRDVREKYDARRVSKEHEKLIKELLA